MQIFAGQLVWYRITTLPIFCMQLLVIIGCHADDITVQNNQPFSTFGISLSSICQKLMHMCVRWVMHGKKVQISVNIWSKVQTDSHKYLWIFGWGEAKHRHHKARANTLFVIGRNIDGSVMDLRRFYLIISRVQTIPLWSKTTSRVTSVSTCWFWNWKKHQ